MGKITWDPLFAPSYTPLKMLEMGVFEGKYINAVKGLPASWYKLPKVVGPDDPPDPSLNFYGVKSRTSLKEWQRNGVIKTDKAGWFEWYCRYYLGRRLGEEDSWQIGRWRSFVARHNAQVQAKCRKGDRNCHSKQRQGLLQWAWNSDTKFDEKQLRINLEKLQKDNKANITLESTSSLITFQW